jgi:hypothetical protein
MQAAKRLKTLWKEDKVMAVRQHPRLVEEDMVENFAYVLEDWYHGKNDPTELVERVRRGVKPMATIVLRDGKCPCFSENNLKRAALEMSLSCHVVSIKSGIMSRRVAVVYQPLKTLSKYYPPDETIARYRAAGVELTRSLFNQPLETFAASLAQEDFQADIKLPLVGMCFGYPVGETLSTLGWSARSIKPGLP